MTTQDPEIPQQPERPPLYQVSFERLAELKRSAVAMVADRRPRSCPSRQRPDHELTDAQELIEEIAEHWGGQEWLHSHRNADTRDRISRFVGPAQ